MGGRTVAGYKLDVWSDGMEAEIVCAGRRSVKMGRMLLSSNIPDKSTNVIAKSRCASNNPCSSTPVIGLEKR